MDEEMRKQRRDTFLGDASDYAELRPGYPEAALAAAASVASLTRGDPVLEIGCGTGQATRWLAAQGYDVAALDRSREMVALAAKRTSEWPNVDVRHEDFEELPVSPAYAALLCATSYHWLDPSDRVARCAGHLRDRGALILLWHTHPRPFTGFFERVQSIYGRHVSDWEPPPSPGMVEARIQGIVSELDGSGLFERAVRRSFDWSRVYERSEYQRLLCTYSDHQLLPDASRAALLEEVGTLVDREFGGQVDRPYRTELIVARSGRHDR